MVTGAAGGRHRIRRPGGGRRVTVWRTRLRERSPLARPGYARPVSDRDDDREVDLDEDLVILPDQTRDDTDAGWGEVRADNDRRLLEDRPPHW